ncbi:Polyisoprenoid-binding protein YceI [Pseudoxanthomonas indica]|uniref:Polyisoprenoid-binding protein YceI n=2 Tax=Pseudoxanthomonas indica TaxID=428993 RepID=A0A1T5LJG7_9GAMM|nr:Polyisoprenoid-binding protein YceI [Pseudoxanthomonas indica]
MSRRCLSLLSRPLPAVPGLVGLLLAAGLMAQAQAQQAQDYRIDPVHTRVMFAVEHAGFSHAIGTVSGSSGQLRFDPQDWSQARLDVSVPLTRLDLGDDKWNKAALAGNLLDGKRFPEARFVSTRVEPQAADRAFVYGDLSLHGVTREVRLDVTFNALKRHPMPPFRRTAGFSATTTIKRSDFGITSWKSVIGDEVELRIEAEAIRGGAADNEAAPTPDDTLPATDPSVPATEPAESEPEPTP